MLPCDAYKGLDSSQWVQPTDEMPVILVCEICKHAYIYSPHPNSRYHHPTDTSGWYIHSEVVGRPIPLQCVGENNEFRLPLVLLMWRDGIREGEKREIAAMWIGGHLECPSQHRIHWPFRQA
jgi:hypothetical protein